MLDFIILFGIIKRKDVICLARLIDREQEMETLQSEYERKGSSLVILYGRRRAGKTTLISEFIKDKNA
ncbi:MAG: ATP-binding protein, partial [Oscillospiraceae bacterium]|nr:ATP-binding protein [Oscillospiraceae bacterium]